MISHFIHYIFFRSQENSSVMLPRHEKVHIRKKTLRKEQNLSVQFPMEILKILF